MPAFEGIAAIFVHPFHHRRGAAGKGQGQVEALFFSVQVPQHRVKAAVRRFQDQGGIVPVGRFPLQSGEEREGPQGGLGDQAVGHQAEAAVEGAGGDSLLLEYVPERPIAVARRHVAQLGQQPGAQGGVVIGIVNGAEGVVAGVEFGNIHGNVFEFREGSDDAPGFPHFGHQILRPAHGMVQVAAFALRGLAHVGVACDEIHGKLFVPAEGEEVGDPLLAALAAADGGAAYPHIGQRFLHRQHCGLVQLQIFGLIGVFPEAGQVGLVPDFAGPIFHPFFSVPLR